MEVIAIASAVDQPALSAAVVVSVFLAGLRHGFDLDHIAAIADITSSQIHRGRALLLATLYALGHAVVLLVLGSLAVVWGRRIPETLDSLMGRLIGATLVALGIYVAYSLVRFRRDFRPRSRWMLVLAGARRGLRWLRARRHEQIEIEHVHEHEVGGHDHDEGAPATSSEAVTVDVTTKTHAHPHKHLVTVPADPFTEYGAAASFGVGMIHGVGAETPSQIVLLTTAAGVAGTLGAAFVLVAFVAGLFLGNSILAVATAAGYARGRTFSTLYMVVAGATAVVSMSVGALYLVGRGDLLGGLLSA